jgi:hypothetical protein
MEFLHLRTCWRKDWHFFEISLGINMSSAGKRLGKQEYLERNFATIILCPSLSFKFQDSEVQFRKI